ncbi:MAG: HlyC/CorC family transporter [Minwuia sp.]|uniref:HlyC/CorC family transporter n=1 Tax=Minwuia sp. TaxID=2493630 RepID=UPI003A858A3F
MEWTLIISLGAILLLLVLSAFFSGSETALTAASRARMHHLERLGNKRAAKVSQLVEQQERLIGSILLGNNLVNILASSLATTVLIALVGDAAVAIATLVMTLLVLIFAEVLPKTFAIRNPDRMALAVAPIIGFLVPVLSPAVNAIQAVVRTTLKIFGAYDTPANDISVEDELKGTIELHARDGTVRKTAKDMLGSILELDDVDLSEVMQHRRRVVMLNADDPPEQIVASALASSHTRIPLFRGEREEVIGILHAKDLARELARNGGDAARIDVEEVAREPWFVPETTTLREQLNAFRRRQAHFALVIDEYGDLQGIVTLEDILEEIVGDISDEFDTATPGIKALPDGSFEVEGSVTIRDLNRRFDWHLPDEEAATVAGLVVYEAQTLPDPGQIFRFHSFTFEVLERRRNRINRLKITPPEPQK